ncbi:MAG: oligosaccharide flippase family protein [Planctomycetota bacterium]
MSVRGRFARGAALLLGGKFVGQACTFVRMIIVARLLGEEQMGLAAVFTLTILFLESISTVGADKILVQASDGDSERFQRVAHSVQLIRGLVIGALIAIAAQPLAGLFGQPETAWAFYFVACVPVVRGLQHLDYKRLQREMSYKADTIVETVTQLVLVAAAYPLASLIGDYRTVVILLIGSTLVRTLVTHLVAKRRFGFGWDGELAGRMMGFGWPLMVNGLLMFAILQGDAFLIGTMPQISGAAYSDADLGSYTVAVNFAMAPTAALAAISSKLLLSLLSRAQDDPPAFRRRYLLCVEGLSAAGVLLVLLFVVGGPTLVPLLYGAGYTAAASVIPLIGAMQALRAVRVAPTLAAMSKGDTKMLMHANLVRVSGFVVAGLFAFRGDPITWIAAAGLGAEFAANLFCCVALRKHGLAVLMTLRPTMVLVAAGVAGAAAAAGLGSWSWSPMPSAGMTAAAMAASIPLMLLMLPAFRRELLSGGRMLHGAIESRRGRAAGMDPGEVGPA